MATDEQGVVIDTMLHRRSVREGFLERPVEVPELELIVRCGLAAPSSKNAQPWRFHVVQDKPTLLTIAEAVGSAADADSYVPHDPSTGTPRPEYVSTVRESAAVLRQAAAAVFIENRGVFSGGREELARAEPGALRGSLTGYGLEMIGLGAAVENMWLAANALGIGVAFMGDVVVAEAEVNRCLGISGDLVGVLALGYCAGAPETPSPPRANELVEWH